MIDLLILSMLIILRRYLCRGMGDSRIFDRFIIKFAGSAIVPSDRGTVGWERVPTPFCASNVP